MSSLAWILVILNVIAAIRLGFIFGVGYAVEMTSAEWPYKEGFKIGYSLGYSDSFKYTYQSLITKE